MSPHRRSPRSLAPTLGRLEQTLAPQTALAEIQRIWSAAVGATIAAQATPTTERAGVLTVSCSASVWAQELDLMAPQVLERLNARLPARQRVSRLRCTAVPPRRP